MDLIEKTMRTIKLRCMNIAEGPETLRAEITELAESALAAHASGEYTEVNAERLREVAGELMDLYICPYAWNIYERSAFCEVIDAPCIKTKRMACWLAYLQAKDIE